MPQSEAVRYIRQLGLPFADCIAPSNRDAIDPSIPLVFSHLDYLSIMYPYPAMLPDGDLPLLPLPNDVFQLRAAGRGIRHWRRSAEMLPAGHFYWNDGEREQGSYAVFAGQDLGLLRARLKMTDDDLLPRLLHNATNVTRIDFAINIEAGDPGQCREEFERGGAVTRVKTAHDRQNFAGSPGRTVYFGSEKSYKLLRVYDKAAELKRLADFVLTRIELQVSKAPADRLAQVMRRHGVRETGKTAIREFIDFPDLGWYQDAVSGPHVDMQLTPVRQADFMTWLDTLVGPAIEKRIEAGEFHAEIRDWLHALYELLRKPAIPPNDKAP